MKYENLVLLAFILVIQVNHYLFAEQGNIPVKKVSAWEMSPIYTKAEAVRKDRSIALHDTRLNPFIMPLSGKKIGGRATIGKPLPHDFKQPEQVIKDPTRPTYHLISRSKKTHIADPVEFSNRMMQLVELPQPRHPMQ